MRTTSQAFDAEVLSRSLRAQVRAFFGLRRPQTPRAFPPISSRYEIRRQIAQRPHTTVYFADDRCGDQPAALKILREGADPELRQRFRREAACALILDHPNVIRVYQVGCCRGRDFLAMEYIHGKTLDRWIPVRGIRHGAFLALALQMAHAVSAVHSARMIHRDLKPANFIVSTEGTVKLLDFGLAKVIREKRSRPLNDSCDASLTPEGTILGSPGYMSPEQVRGEPADQRSDIFALGAIWYYMLSGRRPFHRNTSIEEMNAILHSRPPKLQARFSRAVTRVVRRCLERDPARRYQSVNALIEDLNRAAQP